MICERCKAAATHANYDERAAKFDEATDSICGCEAFSVSDFSPGPVGDVEVLHLLITDPQMLVDGYLHPSRAQHFHTSGQSVLRDEASNAEFIATIIALKQRAQAANKELYFHSVLSFEAGTVRYKNADKSERLLCIYDTAEQQKPHHADLMSPNFDLSGVPSVTAKKRKIFEFARLAVDAMGKQYTGTAEFRAGAFIEFARAAA